MKAVPGVKPVTTPVGEIDMFAEPVLQTPARVVSYSVTVAPWHTVDGPTMMPGLGMVFIVTMVVAAVGPQSLITV
jgi:hypothetical protein